MIIWSLAVSVKGGLEKRERRDITESWGSKEGANREFEGIWLLTLNAKVEKRFMRQRMPEAKEVR